jgi:hypothetical protein
MSNIKPQKTDAALLKRVSTLEALVGKLSNEVVKLHEIIKLIAPTINVSLSKSMKTTVIQVIQWSMRRDAPQQEAIKNAFDRLKERGFVEKDFTPELTKYIRENAARIYAEAAGEGWPASEEVPGTESEPENQTKTAGDGTE